MTSAEAVSRRRRAAAAALALAGAYALLAALGHARAAAPPQPPSPAQFDVALGEVRIPMRDGASLAADLWRPKGAAAGGRFPVLLEYLPYRKTEARGDRSSFYSYFVRRGYVVARVDIRGTGNSEGTLIPYEYSEIEQRDGEDVIAWLARQPFSNGNVGMFGISWGGFNSIHMAMRNPPGPEGDHRGRRDGRPVPGRRALHGRHDPRGLVGDEPGPRQRHARRARLPDRRALLPRSASTSRRGC